MAVCVKMMSKGSKVVFVAYVYTQSHNIDTFSAMLKGLKEALTVWLMCTHNIDTFNAMLKGSKDYVMLKQGTNTFLLITFLIFN